MKLPFHIACIFLFSAPVLAQTSTPATVTVFAAASLKESLDKVSTEWTRQSGQKVVVSYAGSSELAKQIENGAPADVFISADSQWMDYLQQRNLIDQTTRFDLVGNRLVLIAPATSALQSVALEPAAILKAIGDGRLSTAETISVPAGRYARQSLANLGLWDTVSGKLAESDNVRAAMLFVARGDAPLGIVYATDSQAESRVRVVATFPDDSHDAIIYPAARVVRANASMIKGFLKFLRGPEAITIFKKAGFRTR